LKNEKFKSAFFVLISPNLKSFSINMPFAVHWNPPGANKKIAKIALFAKMTFSQFLNDCNFFI